MGLGSGVEPMGRRRVQACARVLLPLANRIATITYDNGKEFASRVEIATSVGSLSTISSGAGCSGLSSSDCCFPG
jgi:hypothetical protein